jgi:hypothetical protein
MLRKLAILLAILTALIVTAATALAANPHIVGGTSTTVSGATVTMTGKIAGLGSGFNGAAVTGTADVSFSVNCSNPQGKFAGGHQGLTSPGTSGSGTVNSDSNGNYTFTISFNIGPLVPARAFGCPNNQWTANPVGISATLTSLTVGGTAIDI